MTEPPNGLSRTVRHHRLAEPTVSARASSLRRAGAPVTMARAVNQMQAAKLARVRDEAPAGPAGTGYARGTSSPAWAWYPSRTPPTDAADCRSCQPAGPAPANSAVGRWPGIIKDGGYHAVTAGAGGRH